FKNLFGFDLHVTEREGIDVLGAFMAAWLKLEQAFGNLATKYHHLKASHRRIEPIFVIRELVSQGLIKKSTAKEIENLRQIRNEVVHGISDYKTILDVEIIKKVNAITQELEQRLSEVG
ncbi:MAG TPA: hypothetical protein VMX17_09310, partial [Candidatus Glassbacteria bacterium]|nr:hypothetical protein [Candidatus Glassbacteria bacterium]